MKSEIEMPASSTTSPGAVEAAGPARGWNRDELKITVLRVPIEFMEIELTT